MKINATRSRRFVVCTTDALDNGTATEYGASNERSHASLMAFSLCKTQQSEGFHKERYFVVDAKTGETTEHLVDRHSGRSSIQPAEAITRFYE